ncbi:MAG: ROK family protein [Armatimonadota bacterium]
MLLAINPNGAPVAGVRIAPESVEIAIATSTINILARRVLTYDVMGRDVEHIVDAIVDGVARCARAADVDIKELSGVGVAVHGLVDPVLGIIEEMTNRQGWENVPIARMLEDRLGLPVVADNCIRAGAITYQWFSSERRDGGTLFLTIAEGVGAALLHNQEIVRGIHHSGNQLGHTIIDRNGPECGCGNRGCLEALTSDLSLVRRLWPEAAKKAVDMTIEEREGFVRRAFDLATGGDARAREALDDVIESLGIGIANGIALFGPRTVVVSGTLIDLAPTMVIDEIRKAALRYIRQRDIGIEIRAAVNYRDFLLRGALGLILCHPYRVMREQSLLLGEVQAEAAVGSHRHK